MQKLFEILNKINSLKLKKVGQNVYKSPHFKVNNFPFLSENNNYNSLFEYLDQDNEFIKYFTEELHLQMGLFAYTSADGKNLRYLYGKQDYSDDKNSGTNPHFYLPIFWNKKRDEYSLHNNIDNIMHAFYNFRKHEEIRNIDFIKSLNGKTNTRTLLEKNHNLIYASSGEMDFFSLALFLLSFNKQSLSNDILENTKIHFDWDTCFDASEINRGEEYRYLPFIGMSTNITVWFEEFGFVENNQLTERGERLIFWVNSYIESFDLENGYYGIFSIKDEKWLEGTETNNSAIANNINGLLRVCNIIINWYIKNKVEEPLKDLYSRSRFSIIPHFILRNYNGTGKKDQYSRAWIVYPILYDNSANNEHKAVGFFLGTFRDVITIDGKEQGIFEYITNNNGKIPPEAVNLINKQKLLIKTIAEVEDNEIYFKSIINKVAREKQEKTLLAATKNAISKVEIRNQSHNIGSHVLSRMVVPKDIDIDTIVSDDNMNYTSFIKGKIKEEIIDKRYVSLKNKYWEKHKELNIESCIKEIDSLLYKEAKKVYYNKLISNFFSYLKTRQDFLADIVSGVPQMQNTKWFKEEIMKGIDANKLLLNRISGVGDNFKYRFQCIIDIENHDDVQMAIANDVMGQHAFYIILENIIRNTAKHGPSKKEEGSKYKFIFHIEESELDSSHYKVTIYDNISINGTTYLKLKQDRVIFKPKTIKYFADKEVVSNGKNILISNICINNKFGIEDDPNTEGVKEFTTAFLKRAKDYENELEYIGSDDEYDYFKLEKINHLVTLQNIWINRKILVDTDTTIELRQQAIGMIEMETCTAYLRRIEIDQIEAKQFELQFAKEDISEVVSKIKTGDLKLRLLRAVRPKDKSTDNTTNKKPHLPHLGYRFYIPKPKELLIIDEVGDLWKKCVIKNDYSNLKKLESNGILLLNAVKDFERNDKNKHWIFEPNEVYQHSIMLLNLKEDSKPNFDFVKLPKRKVFYTDVKKCFKLYKDKFNNKINGKIIANSVNYEISIDLLNDDSLGFIREVWRTYIYNKMLVNSINKFSSSLDNLLPVINRGKEYNITYSHHGKEKRKKWEGEYFAIFESKFENIEEKFVDPDKIGKSIVLQFKAIDAALTNVLVLDERIQELSKNKYTLQNNANTKLEYRKIWDFMHIHIPKEEVLNLREKTFENEKGYRQNIKDLIQVQFLGEKRKKKKLDYIVIHLGIIEKILVSESNESKNDEYIKEYIKDLETFSGAKVIITSGRAPQNLPENFSFISYSLLSQYLIENRFKLHFNELINASRPKTY